MKLSKFLFPLTIILAVGICIADIYSIAFIYSVPLLILSIIAGLFFFYARNSEMNFISVLLVIFFTGCILTNARKTTMSENSLLLPQQGFCNFKAIITKPEETANFRIRMEMKVLEIGGNPSIAARNIKILTIYDPQKLDEEISHFKPGQIVSFSGIVLPPSEGANPWEFDYKRYLNLNGITTVVLIPSPEKITVEGEEAPGIIARTILGVREKLRNVISSSIPSPESNLMMGILLGKRKELPKEIEDSFRRTGTIHILAASGLHISIVMAFFILLFRKLKFKRAAIHLLTVIPVIFYALLAGGSPSVVRASIMGVLFLLASAVEKDYNPLRALFFSAFVLLLINPYNLFNTSFQMSFSAVAGILILYPFFISLLPSKTDLRKLLEQKLSKKTASIITEGCYFLVMTVVISISAQLALMPVLAYYFNEISLVNLPANLILIPLTSVILPLGFVGGFTGMIFYPLGKFILVYSFIPLKIAITASSIMGGSPFSSIIVPSPTPAFIILYYSFLLALGLNIPFLKNYRKTLILLLILTACIFVSLSVSQSVKEQKITIFDTIHSTSVFVQHKNIKMMTVRLKGKTGRRALKEIEWKTIPFLKKKGISKVDILIISCRENTDPLVVKEITEIIRSKRLLISSPPNINLKTGVSVSSGQLPDDCILVEKEDLEIDIKDAKFIINKSDGWKDECIFYKWNNGLLILPDNENQYLKSLYRRGELLNNMILIVESMPSEEAMTDKIINQSGEDVYIIDSTNLSVIKTGELKKFPSRINNKTGKGKRPLNNGAIIFDVSSLKIHQVNSDKKNQEK